MPERELVNTPVPVVQKGRLDIETRSGDFELPIAVSRDWTKPQDDVTRAVIVIPGWPRRDLRSGEHAAEVAGAAVVAEEAELLELLPHAAATRATPASTAPVTNRYRGAPI